MAELKTTIREQDPFRFIKRLPWEKIAIWAIFLLLLYALRGFFGVLFITFILSYIAHNVVDWACERMGIAHRPTHPLRYVTTVAFYLLFLGILTGAGWIVLPRLFDQGRQLAQQAQDLIPAASEERSAEDRADALLRENLGEARYKAFRESPRYYPLRSDIARALRKIPGLKEEKPAQDGTGPVLPRFQPLEPTAASPAGPSPVKRRDIRFHLDNLLKAALGRERFDQFQGSPAYQQTYGQIVRSLQNVATENLPALADLLTAVAAKLLNYSLNFLVSILFSFLIVLGIPRFGKQMRSLAESRLSNFYAEIAPSVVSFGRSMGMAFQGQAIIALMNTALTLVGLVVLGVPNPIALGVIVFVCSFIPVLGVLISSAPILVVSLQAGGITLAVEAMILIVVIHALEAYLLNPRILGTVMKMHPLLVLVILFVGEHFFGVWGLLIGVPLCHYLFNHVILKKPIPERRPRRTQTLRASLAVPDGEDPEPGLQPQREEETR